MDLEKGSPASKATNYCIVSGTILLLLLGIVGPLVAFVFMSCESTKTCDIGVLLHRVGAVCAEGEGARSEELLHGEVCTIRCLDAGLSPSKAHLECNDGDVQGEDLRCFPPYVPPPAWNGELGLVAGAIVGGSDYDACQRARNVECDAPPGGAGILLMLYDLQEYECIELLNQCRALNSAFEFMQHIGDTPTSVLGTCTFGCFVPAVSAEIAALYTPAPVLPTERPSFATPEPDIQQCFGEDAGPMCVKVTGSCNAGDDRDYYRHRYCASGAYQWVSLDEQYRIRWDARPAYSQGGKWLLETGILGPGLGGYGTEHARQQSFDSLPVLGTEDWNFMCQNQINSYTVQVTMETLALTLGECTCTDAEDCSGHGTAIGSKIEGPYCQCVCNEGRRGTHCEVPLCPAPQIENGALPACAEGRWIHGGGICTPTCAEGYVPSLAQLVCAADGSIMEPQSFVCRPSATGPIGNDGPPGGTDWFSSTPLPDCSPLDCYWRGTPTGERRNDGSCVCECDPLFTGNQCQTRLGDCWAPLPSTIEHSMSPSTCEEGANIETTCTAECEAGYYPMPATLTCTGTDLDPPTFQCFGGPSPREQWCNMIKYISVAVSVCSALALLSVCFCKREYFHMCLSSERTGGGAFEVKGQAIDHVKDDDGAYHVVHMEGKDPAMNSWFPDRLLDKQEALGYTAEAYTATLPIEDLQRTPVSPVSTRSIAQAPPSNNALRDAGDTNDTVDQLAGALQDVVSPSATVIVAATAGSSGQPHKSRASTRQSTDAQSNQVLSLMPPEETINKESKELTALPGELALVPVVQMSSTQETAGAYEEAPPLNNEWLAIWWSCEERSYQARKAEEEKLAKMRNAAVDAAAEDLKRRMRESEEARRKAERNIRKCMQQGDTEGLRAAVAAARNSMETVRNDAPTGPLASLQRLIQIADGRLEQLDEYSRRNKGRDEHEERVRKGAAADWSMTQEDLWRHVEAGEVAAVKGGLKAKLLVSARTTDGKRHTLLHYACRHVCRDGIAAEKAMDYVAVAAALIEARANPNAFDAEDRTPLELAVHEGGLGADTSEAVLELRKLGLRTASEAAAEARAETA